MSSAITTAEKDSVLTPPSTPPTPNANPLSDIFSDSPPASPSSTSRSADLSEIPRLRSKHSTAGYRDGITIAKEKFLQPGFDEGYSLGATFGLTVGSLFGKLEGLCLAKRDERADGVEQDSRLMKMLVVMRQELGLENLFGREWWGEDGIWKYQVKPRDDGIPTESDTTFEDIVKSHPLVAKWDVLAEQEIVKAGIKQDRFEGAEWEAGRAHQ